jgi:hypothetical protein
MEMLQTYKALKKQAEKLMRKGAVSEYIYTLNRLQEYKNMMHRIMAN